MIAAYVSPTGNEAADDQGLVNGGYFYDKDIKSNDSDADSLENSCDRASQRDNSDDDRTNNSGAEGGGGLFVGGLRCIGNCAIPIGSVTITDLPMEGSE
jgi:hypothetical protein